MRGSGNWGWEDSLDGREGSELRRRSRMTLPQRALQPAPGWRSAAAPGRPLRERLQRYSDAAEWAGREAPLPPEPRPSTGPRQQLGGQ